MCGRDWSSDVCSSDLGNATDMPQRSNGTSTEFEVLACINGMPRCSTSVAGRMMVLLLAIVSISINIMHVNTLSKITALKKTSLLTLLKAHSLSEVMFSLVAFSRISCCLRMMYMNDRHLATVFSISSTLSDGYGNIVLATLLVERNVSMYYSLKEKEAWMLKHVVWILVGEFLLLLAVSVLRDLMFPDLICFLPVRGAVNMMAGMPLRIQMSWRAVVNVTVVIGLIALMRQMNNVKYKPLNGLQKAALNGGKYAVLMTIGYFSSLIPVVLSVLVINNYSVGLDLNQAEVGRIVTQLIYGLFCCILYALVSQAYRTELRCSLKWFIAKLRNLS